MFEEKEENNNGNLFLYILLALVLVTIASSFYFFYLKKDYDFFIETQCNPEMELCFFRDCENSLDGCPPNNLSHYNQYSIKAKDFKLCPNEDCTQVCKNNIINCIKTECTKKDIEDRTCVGLYDVRILN